VINIKYSNTLSINAFIVSIVPLLILGPFIPDLIVSISVLFFLYYVFKKKNFYFFNNYPIIIFFIFCIYCILLSLFVAEDMILSFQSSLFYFRIGVFSCLIWYLIDKNKNILNYFYYILVISFLILIIDGYFQYFQGKNLLGYKIIGPRVSSFFKDELILGSYLSRLFPLLFALFLIKKKKKYEAYFIGLLFVLIDILIYLSGERAAFFFLNLSTIFIIFFIKEYQIFRLVTYVVAIIIIFTLSLSSKNLSNRMFSIPANNLKEKILFTEAHDSLFRTAYNAFQTKPIFGHGPKMFRIICNEKNIKTGIKPCDTHPHNFYLQLLAETGIIGFLFLFAALFYVSITIFNQLRSIIFKQKRHLTDYQVALLAAILITLWPFTTNGNFFNNWLMIVYSLPIGFYLQSMYSKT
jgi:O-antigen ligase